ncbi:MAG: response regulator [Myxococcales bacterium]|nr:response regulator [Myxococcales bacterium]
MSRDVRERMLAIGDPFLVYVALPLAAVVATLGTAGAAIGLLTNRIIWTLETALTDATQALERERVERGERERAQDALARAQRLEAVGRLAAGVAHDLNNSLAVVLCNAESLRSQEDDHGRLLSDLINAARSAEETTRQLTFLGRKDTEAGKSCIPTTVVEQLVRSVQRLLPPGILLQVRGESARSVALSGARLEQILLNLVLNARDAMPAGGTVRLSIEDRGEQLVLTVTDDGVGMSEEVRDRVFEPFFTTKEPGRGIGLGLSMVHGLVTEVGGTVEVASAPGKGTTFTLCLPAVAPAASAPSEPRLVPSRRAKILLLEDEPFVLRAIQRVLRAAGHEVTSAVDGAGAEEALATAGDFDLLFTDAVVPGTDTSSVIAHFLERHPRAPVLVCSGFVREELVRRGIRAGEFFFLKKPFEPATLRAAVDEALGAAPPS